MFEMSPGIILISILLFSWLEFLWESYLNLRQLRIYETITKIPTDIRDVMTEDAFNKARLYGMDKMRYKMYKNIFNIVLSSVMLYYGWLSLAWSSSIGVLNYLQFGVTYEIVISCVFIVILNFLSFFLDLPFSLYYTFVLEEKHGFNKQTLSFYIKDKLKSIIVNQIITVPFISIAVYIIQIGGDRFVLWLWLFATIVTFVLIMIYPTVIAPLFDKFTPLSEGSLRSGIESLAVSVKFPLSQIYIVEGSKRSAHSNAYFTGIFGAKRIVLFDTLLEKYSEEKKITTGCAEKEILGILAHELGHWKCSHTYKFIAITELNLFLLFSAFAFLFEYSLLYEALGFDKGNEPIIVGLIAVTQLVLVPYNSLLSFLMTVLSRKFEFEADDFAIALNYATELKSALVKLGSDNLDYPVYDKLFSAWYHSHPTLLQRIESISNKAKKVK